MSAAELKAELKALRKEHPDYTPVSKMKKGDVSALIQRLKAGREETPNVAATGAQEPKVATVETIQHAKEKMAPTVKKMAKKPAKAEAPVAVVEKKKVMKKAGKEAPAPKGRPAKGSEEAKAHMAAIRAKKTKKDDA